MIANRRHPEIGCRLRYFAMWSLSKAVITGRTVFVAFFVGSWYGNHAKHPRVNVFSIDEHRQLNHVPKQGAEFLSFGKNVCSVRYMPFCAGTYNCAV